MTKLLQEAWDRVSKLPDEEQDRIARELLEELGDTEWDRILAETQDELRKLGEEAREEYRTGRTEPLDLDRF